MSVNSPTPAVSRVLDDGTLIELVFDPAKRETAFAIASPSGRVEIEPHFDLPGGERLVPYSASNNLISSGCVLLPSDVGEFGDERDLIERVRGFLHRYVDLSAEFEMIAAHYVLLSWVYDAFNDVPYLRLRGGYGTGKTRGLLAIGSLCHKPFFASGASTVSPIFHIQDAFQGVLVLDEADFRFSDATSELAKILNNGTTRGLPVLRTMTNRHKELNPTAFRVFGPKIVAMRGRFADEALESRFITEGTGERGPRPDIPVQLPSTFADEARELRNALLAWRLSSFHRTGPAADRLPADLSPRARQMALSLVSLIDGEPLRVAVCERFAQSTKGEAQGPPVDEVMISVLEEAFAETDAPSVPVAEVARRFNARAAERFELSMSNKWVGWFVRTQLRVTTMKSGGVYVIPRTERARVAALSARAA